MLVSQTFVLATRLRHCLDLCLNVNKLPKDMDKVTNEIETLSLGEQMSLNCFV